jgi:hypothetical protein
VSIAFTWRGSASPRQRNRNFSAAVVPCETTSSARLVVRDLVQLAELPLARQSRRLRLEICRRVSAEARGLVRLRLGHLRAEIAVDEQAPDVLVRVVAHELLDVHAAIAQRPAVSVGLRDLGLDRDDPLEAWLELVHGRKSTDLR